MEDKKEELSSHVENIFKQYVHPGLYICDLATGGGKSYTIGKLTCEFYPKYFERIIILCVQNKLIEGMNREIEKFIDQDGGLKSDEKLIVENNAEVVLKACGSGSLKSLLDEMVYQVGELRKHHAVGNLEGKIQQVRKYVASLETWVRILEDDPNNASAKEAVNEVEQKIRYAIKNFFNTYKHLLQADGVVKNVSIKYVLKHFPSLEKVYPQVNLHSKKVLLMTVQKATYGIDPILSESVHLKNFTDKQTLIIVDESDQAAVAMRDVIIEQACNKLGGENRYSRGYLGYLQYLDLVNSRNELSTAYYDDKLVGALEKGQSIIQENWKRKMGNVVPYKNIFLRSSEPIDSYRRGVFFSGSLFKLDIGSGKEKGRAYICYKHGEKEFRLGHSLDGEDLRKEFQVVVPLDDFLRMVGGNVTAVKKQLCNLIQESLKRRQEEFRIMVDDKDQYMGWPTQERETHTLMARFESGAEKIIEQQLLDYMTNRKNLDIMADDKKIKMADDSFYMQGCQLYQEDIDDRDSAHRVRLSCREITTTPEKILYSLVISGQVTVVLCSATASSKSVISNLDIDHLKFVLGDRVHTLSEEESEKFDALVAATYPKGHRVYTESLQHYRYADKRKEKVRLLDHYCRMFCQDAVDDGYVDEWFKLARERVYKTGGESSDPTFEFYRIYQFIEAYHWFHTHDDIHSMLFFQNRSAVKDKALMTQMRVLACLIDGSYKDQLKSGDFDDGLPEWENEHLFMSNNLQEVEKVVLNGLSDGSLSKVMLVTAYGSFKAGANLQYQVPEGLDFLKGDNWEKDESKLKKDWDAIYLQSPTSYLTMDGDRTGLADEQGIYRVMMSLMMLKERGWLSPNQVKRWLDCAVSGGKLYFREESVARDKASWALTILEQAVGRICRTRNKPHTTYILYDEDMKGYFMRVGLQKSQTMEFKALVSDVVAHYGESDMDMCRVDAEKRMNDAAEARRALNRMRRNALHFTPHPFSDEEDFDEDEEQNGIPFRVKNGQIMNQYYKQAIITQPVIDSFEELTEKSKIVTFLHKCYGDWARNDLGEIEGSSVSPSSVRLDILMKNDVIRAHFEQNGYATEWKPGGLILHPEILMADYAGEIGEEAFRALVLRYTHCDEDAFAHLEGRDYELADFVINDADGNHKVAFDVKNMNPLIEHNDREGDLATSRKRKIKEERLGCPLYTVNMLKMPDDSMDSHEICGVIDKEGHVIPEVMERIKKLIES